ncbi:hypothetical protein T484DRAFT_2023358, partial [Baffinella frigidus]
RVCRGFSARGGRSSGGWRSEAASSEQVTGLCRAPRWRRSCTRTTKRSRATSARTGISHTIPPPRSRPLAGRLGSTRKPSRSSSTPRSWPTPRVAHARAPGTHGSSSSSRR